MKMKGKNIFSLFMVVFFAATILMSIGYPEKARMVPLVIAIPGIVLALIQLIADLTGRKPKAGGAGEPKTQTDEVAEETGLTPQEIKKRELIMVLWILAVLGLVLVFGFWIAIAATLLFFTKLYGKESWKVSIWSAVGGLSFIYVIFQLVLEVPLFEGFLFRFIA